jgi:hypothetical protein
MLNHLYTSDHLVVTENELVHRGRLLSYLRLCGHSASMAMFALKR